MIIHVFSDRFEKDTETIIKRNRNPQLNRDLRRAVSFTLVILISGCSVMARSLISWAAVMRWLFGRESDACVYRSTCTDIDEETITSYNLAEIPEGF